MILFCMNVIYQRNIYSSNEIENLHVGTMFMQTLKYNDCPHNSML